YPDVANICLGRSSNLRPLGGTSLAIAIRGGGCEGARGRDRALRLPVIRLRPRTFACARTASFGPGASSARSVARFDNTLRPTNTVPGRERSPYSSHLVRGTLGRLIASNLPAVGAPLKRATCAEGLSSMRGTRGPL